MICSICPRKCNVDRSKKLGFCQSPDNFRVARASLHYWEEPCISGKQGSGAVFFSGCNLKCVFCQNNEISSQNKGVEITEEKLIEIFESLIKQGANNINLVNPTHYALQIANVLKRWKSPVPIVYNSSGYEEVETLKELDGLIILSVSDVTIAEKAPPMITPTARSITLPLEINSLNSRKNFFILKFLFSYLFIL